MARSMIPGFGLMHLEGDALGAGCGNSINAWTSSVESEIFSLGIALDY